MQQIDMSNEKHMASAAELPWVKYSAAYSTDAPEKLCFEGKPHEVRPKGPQGAARERIAKVTPSPWGLTPLYLGYCHLNVLEGSVK